MRRRGADLAPHRGQRHGSPHVRRSATRVRRAFPLRRLRHARHRSERRAGRGLHDGEHGEGCARSPGCTRRASHPYCGYSLGGAIGRRWRRPPRSHRHLVVVRELRSSRSLPATALRAATQDPARVSTPEIWAMFTAFSAFGDDYINANEHLVRDEIARREARWHSTGAPSMTGLAGHYRAILGHDASGRIAAIRCPTWIAVGSPGPRHATVLCPADACGDRRIATWKSFPTARTGTTSTSGRNVHRTGAGLPAQTSLGVAPSGERRSFRCKAAVETANPRSCPMRLRVGAHRTLDALPCLVHGIDPVGVAQYANVLERVASIIRRSADNPGIGEPVSRSHPNALALVDGSDDRVHGSHAEQLDHELELAHVPLAIGRHREAGFEPAISGIPGRYVRR